MKLLLNLIIIALSLIGLADASYITYQDLTGQVPPCSPGFQCETVLQSKWAQIGPVPISALGMAYYAAIFILAVWIYAGLPLPAKPDWFKKLGVQPLDCLQVATSIGLGFTAYLVVLMGGIIKAWCLYCLVSATTCLLLFIVTRLYTSHTRPHNSYFLKGLVLNLGHWIYSNVLKKIFFLFQPEKIHNILVFMGSLLGTNPVTQWLTGLVLGFTTTSKRTSLAGIEFPGLVGLSAGFDYHASLTQITPQLGFGWHTIGTITLEPYAGNEPPRLQRMPSSRALLVNKGLKNLGARETIAKLTGLHFKIPVGISIASTNKHFEDAKSQILDIVKCFTLFENSPVKHHYYELNISCPNTFGGEPFTTPDRLNSLLNAIVKLKVKRPIFVKMPIDQSAKETLSLLKVIADHNVAGIIIGNLTKDHNNPHLTAADKALWNKSKGNVSGRPTFQRSNELISLAKKHYNKKLIIIGTGGIFSPADAQKKLDLGADLVQLITGMIFEGPQLIGRINRELAYPKAADVYIGKTVSL